MIKTTIKRDERGLFHVDENGAELYTQRYQKVYPFNTEGFAFVLSNDDFYWRIIDLNGNIINDTRYFSVFDFTNGYAAVRDETGAYHINLKCESIYIRKYKKVFSYNIYGIAIVEDFGGSFHIDSSGQELYKERYKHVGEFMNDGFADVITHKGNRIRIQKSKL